MSSAGKPPGSASARKKRRARRRSGVIVKNGKPVMLSRVARDVTEHRQLKERIEESEEKYRTLFENANAGILLADAGTGTLLDANNAAEFLLGRTRKELIGMNRQKIHPPEEAEYYKKHFLNHVKQGTVNFADALIVRKDGARIPVKISASVIRVKGKKAILGIFNDVTVQKQMEAALKASENKYRALVETTGTGFLILDREGRVIDANAEYVRLSGHHRLREILGRRITEWTIPYERKKNAKAVAECLRNGFIRELVINYAGRDGRETTVEINATTEGKGKTARIISLCRDITGRRRIENTLKMSEQKYRRLVENLGKDYFFYQHDTNGIFNYLSPTMTDMLGYTHKDFLSHYSTYFTDNPLNKKAVQHTRLSLRGIQQPQYEVELRHKNGGTRLLEITEAPLRDAKGKVTGVEGLARDITQRKESEKLLAASEHKYRTLIEASFDLIYVIRRDDTIQYVNPAALKYLGRNYAEVVGRPRASFFPPKVAAHQKLELDRVFANGKPLFLEQEIKLRSVIRYQETHLIPLKGPDGKTDSVLGVSRDITERRRMESVIRENEELLRKVFDAATDAMFVKDTHSRYIKVNKACANIFLLKLEEVPGKTDAEVFPRDVAAEVLKDDLKVLRTGKTVVSNKGRKLASGRYYFNTIKTPLRNSRGEIIGIVGIARDITKIKKLESELALARTLKAVSLKTRPIAHDFNNALAAISGYATLIAEELDAKDPIRPEINMIIKGVKRAAKIASQLQKYARNPKIVSAGCAKRTIQ
ncbi:MAG: hypothetical protein A2021_05505 [Elusimicrobia bacterium GWF2_52_66]|nr:MAG: hypothetical protein A2021_05505 [Elusimicrobia bacterium GWF2_52_66]